MVSKEKGRVPEVDCVVGSVRNTDQILRIESILSAIHNVILNQRIHVMNGDLVVNIVSSDTKITTQITSDDVSAKETPGTRRVELLIDPAIETECLSADLSTKNEVVESFFEALDLAEFGIRSNPRHTLPSLLER